MVFLTNNVQKRPRSFYTRIYLMIASSFWGSYGFAAEPFLLPTKVWYVDDTIDAAFVDYRNGISLYVTFGTFCEAAVLGVSDRYTEDRVPETAELLVDGQRHSLPFIGTQQGEAAFQLSLEALRALKTGLDGTVFTNVHNYRLPLVGSSSAIEKARAICERR